MVSQTIVAISSSLASGTQTDTEALREEITQELAPIGLRLSPAKTTVGDMREGFDFLGFHIQWRRKRGSTKWQVYTYIADRLVRSVKAKIRALTHRNSQQDLRYVLTRLNQIMRGWSAYFRHAVAKHTFSRIAQFAWRRVVTLVRTRHRWRWPDVRRWLIGPTGRWKPPAVEGIELFNMETVTVTRYRHRGSKIPNPWAPPINA